MVRDRVETKMFVFAYSLNLFLLLRKFAREIDENYKISRKISRKLKLENLNGKERVIIQPDDKINVMISEMITPNEKKNVIIQLDDNSD
jgi:hypothetical protein